METSLVKVVAIHATAETTKPTAPAKGSNQGTWTGWKTIGSVKNSAHDANLEGITIPGTEYEGKKIQAPLDLAPDDLILLKNGIGEGSIIVSEPSEEILTLASNLTIGSNIATQAGSLTFRTVVIEINGLKQLYYPKVALIAVGRPGDHTETYQQQEFMMIPLATSSVPGGVQEEWYQAV